MDAKAYWLSELSNRSPSTRDHYGKFLDQFCGFVGKTPDELIAARKDDLVSDDPRVQRRVESDLKAFISSLEERRFSTSTLQVAYASVRSFFEMHYQPLRMRRGDYPQGESLGSRAATKDDIRILTEDSGSRLKAVVYFLKDTGLRVSDALKLCYRDVSEGIEKGEKCFPLFIITKKNRVTAKTFVGSEAIDALNEYFEDRRKGTRRIPPETIGPDSPLFRAKTPKVVSLSRSGLSALILFSAKRKGINRDFSAHSFRKYFQTCLESAGVNANWIDQMMGHKLINSRDAYSLPSDQQLLEAYAKAYQHLAVGELESAERLTMLESKLTEKDQIISSLVMGNEQLRTQVMKNDQVLVAMQDFLSKLPGFMLTADGKPPTVKNAEFKQALKDFRKAVEPKK